jgi:hypothetical protein
MGRAGQEDAHHLGYRHVGCGASVSRISAATAARPRLVSAKFGPLASNRRAARVLAEEHVGGVEIFEGAALVEEAAVRGYVVGGKLVHERVGANHLFDSIPQQHDRKLRIALGLVADASQGRSRLD